MITPHTLIGRSGALLATAVLALQAAASAASAAPAAFRAGDYAYAATLAVDGQAALYRVPLSAQVYQDTASAALEDICVINGLDEIIPFALQRSRSELDAGESTAALPLFPLLGDSATPSDTLRLRLTTGSSSVEVEQPAANAAATGTANYLIDVRQVPNPVAALRLEWPSETPDFSASARIESSSDLVHWSALVEEAPVIDLHFNGEEFRRAEISLPPVSRTVLRLSWRGHAPAVAISGIVGVMRAPREVQRQATRATPSETTASGDYDFDLGGHPPIDRLNLELPEANTVVAVEFSYRNDNAAAWQQAAHGKLYRLAVPGSAELTNVALAIPVTSARYWRAHVATAGGGLGRGQPTLAAGWLADDVLFVARGTPPFRLIYGNAEARSLAVPAASLTHPGDAVGTTAAPLAARLAAMGEPSVLGGEARLEPAAPGIDRKRWILWAVLILGVALLGRMAWKLSRALPPA